MTADSHSSCKLAQFVIISDLLNGIEIISGYLDLNWMLIATLIIHEYRCPLDYCIDDNDSVNVTLEDPSVQCDFNRIGLLCGRCGQNFDLALGSLHCIPCNNNHSA